MFGISMTEIGVVLVVALIILGPRQLVDVAKLLGKLYREVQKLSWDIRNAVDLDTPTVSQPQYPPASTPRGVDAAEGADNDLIPPSDEKSGPDFYAELLESSAENDEEPGDADSETADNSKEESTAHEDKIEKKPEDKPKHGVEQTDRKEGEEQ